MNKPKHLKNKNVKQPPALIKKNASKHPSELTNIIKYLPYALLLIDIILVILIRINFLNIPFERDEGAYSYYGKLLLEGKTPYVDFYEQKFPGIFYNYALIVWIFGATVKGMHLGFIFINILTIVMIFFIAKLLFNDLCAVVSTMSFSLISLIPFASGFTIQSEHLVAFYTSIGFLLLVLAFKKDNLWLFLASGITFGLAFLTKTNGVFFCLFAGFATITYAIFEKKFVLRNLLIYPAVLTLGFLLICGLFIGLIAFQGAFDEMIFWAYKIPKNYISKMPFNEGIKYFKLSFSSILINYKFFWFTGFAGVLLIFFLRIELYKKITLFLFILFSALSIVPGYFFYGHYFIQLLPALALLTGIFFYFIGFLLRKNLNTAILVPISVFLLFFFGNVNNQKEYYFQPDYTKILRQVYGMNPFPEAKVISDFIMKEAKKDDKIIVMGSEPQIYFYTGINCPSKFAYFSAIVNDVPEHKQWQREFISDVEKSKPEFFIFFNNPISLLVQPNTDQKVFEWANDYVNKNYKVIGVVDMIDNFTTNYVWEKDLETYQLKGNYSAYIFSKL